MKSLGVVGLDAADLRLVKKWNCENILLENHRELKTETYSTEVPSTIEVWPTIATGLSPDEHGVILDAYKRPSRGRLFRAATWAVGRFPKTIRENIIQLRKTVSESKKPTTDKKHMFESGLVKNWPGITESPDWIEEEEWFKSLHRDEMPEDDFMKLMTASTGKQIGWLCGAISAGYPIAGIHIHFLDYAGHIYAKREGKLKQAYNTMDEFIGWLHDRVDKLLIISDHGMQTSFLNDEYPGVHSFEAMISSTEQGDLPESIYEVGNWVASRTPSAEEVEFSSKVDAPTEHLEDLGYL